RHGAARLGGDQGSRGQADVVDEHTGAPLFAPLVGQGAGDARRAYSRDSHSERRGIWRKERSAQSRDRSVQGGATAGSAGKNQPDTRRSFLLPPRPTPGADEVQGGSEKGRHDYGA